jgi:hypothetical protein
LRRQESVLVGLEKEEREKTMRPGRVIDEEREEGKEKLEERKADRQREEEEPEE